MSDTNRTSNEYLEWRLVSPTHPTPYALMIVRPDNSVSWAVLHAARPLEVRSAVETNGLQRDANRYRYLRERGLFDRYAVRERLADGHLPVFQTRHGDALDRELDECIGQTSPEEPSGLAAQIEDAQRRIAAWPDDVRIALGLPEKATCVHGHNPDVCVECHE